MRTLRTILGIWVVLILGAFLSSCGQMIPILSTDTTLTLGKDQEWSMLYVAVLPGEASILAQQYQESLNQMVQDARLKGITASWELLPPKANETNLSYRVSFSGVSYDLLNQYVFQNVPALIPDSSNEDRVEFSFDPGYSLFSQGRQNIFTLQSSKILASNGTLLNDGSVRWVNPATTMTATVSTAPDLTWLWVSLLGLGVAGMVVAGVGIMRKPAPQKQVLSPALAVSQSPVALHQTGVKYCPQCGQQNPAQAGFCPHCGSKFPQT